MEINKRLLQFIAALQILVFHLWMPVTGEEPELFIIKTGYIGVDLFFFLSAYSLADKEINYRSFIKNRILPLYGSFVFFTLLMAFMHPYFGVKRVVKSLLFIEFFERGGGAFLWFIPAIIIFYLIYPIFLKCKLKGKSVHVLLLWAVLSIVLEKYFSYTAIFIFTQRIPVLVTGYLCKKANASYRLNQGLLKWFGFLLLPIGIILLKSFGYLKKLHIPFRDMYYVAAIPMVISLVLLSLFFKKNKLWNVLGSATLELYALQMIFGAKVVMTIYKRTNDKLITDILMLVFFFFISIMLGFVKRYVKKCIIDYRENRVKEI